RVFSKEICLSNAHHFLCQTDKTKSRKQAREEFVQAKIDLINWGINSGYDTKSLRKLAFFKMEELFNTHQFPVIMNMRIIGLNIHLQPLIEDFDGLIAQPIFHRSNQMKLQI